MKKKINQARHKSIWSKDYQPSKYNPEVCTFTQEIFESSPITSPKVSKNITQSSQSNQTPVIKKRLPGIYYSVQLIIQTPKIINIYI